jgi:hypothetical protein
MLFFQGCWMLLFAAGEAWPFIYQNGTYDGAALASLIAGLLCALVSVYLHVKQTHARLIELNGLNEP